VVAAHPFKLYAPALCKRFLMDTSQVAAAPQ
jgi:hypothetical protein